MEIIKISEIICNLNENIDDLIYYKAQKDIIKMYNNILENECINSGVTIIDTTNKNILKFLCTDIMDFHPSWLHKDALTLLYANGYKKIWNLINTTPKSILSIYGIGKGYLCQIEDLLNYNGVFNLKIDYRFNKRDFNRIFMYEINN